MNCFLCDKTLTRPPHVINGHNLGPECVHKYAAIAAYLEQNDITFPMEFETRLGSSAGFFVSHPDLIALTARVRALGVSLASHRTNPVNRPPVDVITGINPRKEEVKRLVSYLEARAQLVTTIGGVV